MPFDSLDRTSWRRSLFFFHYNPTVNILKTETFSAYWVILVFLWSSWRTCIGYLTCVCDLFKSVYSGGPRFTVLPEGLLYSLHVIWPWIYMLGVRAKQSPTYVFTVLSHAEQKLTWLWGGSAFAQHHWLSHTTEIFQLRPVHHFRW